MLIYDDVIRCLFDMSTNTASYGNIMIVPETFFAKFDFPSKSDFFGFFKKNLDSWHFVYDNKKAGVTDATSGITFGGSD